MDFNPQQKDIIKHVEGPLAVLANPGTGKTRSIVERATQLIQKHNVRDSQILLITFTNKAKKEMNERLEQKLGRNNVYVTTFHSFGARVIREFGYSTLGVEKNFTILDDRQILTFLKKHWEAKYSQLDFSPNSLLYLINDNSNYTLPFENYVSDKGYDVKLTSAIIETYEAYNNWKIQNSTLDLADLQTKALEIVQTDVGKILNNRYKHIMVDEFQDTNEIQLELVKVLARHRNVVIVGDMRQCIYAWRGAQPLNINYFIKHFDAPIINLNRNYRSAGKIINCYNKLIEKSTVKFGAETVPSTSKQGLVKYFKFEDDEAETKAVINIIKEIKQKTKCGYNDFAVLYRTNALSKNFEDAFRIFNIPYELIGSHSFYDRKEVQEFLSLFRWLHNPKDLNSLLRVSSMTKSGVGEKTILQFYNQLEESDLTHNSYESNLEKASPKLQSLLRFLLGLRKKKPFEIANTFLSNYNILERIRTEDKKKNETRADNIQMLLETIKQNYFLTLENLLDNLCVEKPNDDASEEDKVHLMTIHKSKGLEFRTVFLIGFDECILPHEMGMGSESDLEEERRAAYVAISRAKEFLVLTSATYRPNTKSKTFKPSRFLADLDIETSYR